MESTCEASKAPKSLQGRLDSPHYLPNSVFSDINVSSLKLVMMGAFTKQKWTNTVNEGFLFSRKSIAKYPQHIAR
jgi:hypothetical protein